MKTLLEADTPEARAFRKNSRGYNAAFQLASSGLCVDERFSNGERPYRFVLQTWF